VRAIAEVSTAVTQGDLTRTIAVEAQGEVAELKDNINQMIANLRDTTKRNEEQDWLKTNLARISGLMQGQRELRTVTQVIMSELTPTVSAQHGAFFLAEPNPDGERSDTRLRLIASYGYQQRKNVSNTFEFGEGLVGQAAVERKSILITEAPPDYISITSGLGSATPASIIVMPILFEEQVLGAIELASLQTYSEIHRTFLEQLMETLGVVLNTIMANMRTEELLQQSQSLTQELQTQSEELQQRQEELKRSNAELEQQAQSLKASEELLQSQQDKLQRANDELQEKAGLLEERNLDIETKNREIELARLGLEEKAAQLALSSKYKSEFLANMSHELRTPLNSLLILSKLLLENEHGNLSEKQLEFARTIYTAGSDLLQLISDILDLSKIEAGKMEILPDLVSLADVQSYVTSTFDPIAADKGLRFTIEADPVLPATIVTDEQRLEQVLRNLLSNAFKFTEEGGVTLSIERHGSGRIAFAVSDTGVGIAPDKLQVIFEAFQQADGTTSRKYGGTGLGLSISRELARALGGEIEVSSTVGEGTVFTLVLPLSYPHALEARGEAIAPAAPERGSAQPAALLAPPASTGAQATVALPSPRAAGASAVEDTVALAEQDSAVPAVDATVGATPASGAAPADTKHVGRKVLIVDDDVRNLFALASLLEDRGMEVVFGETGKEALAALERHADVDIVLMDIMMPDMDGNETIVAIRETRSPQELPIIAVTAKAMEGDRERSLSAGASDYITKPVEPERLLSLIGAWLGP
jgi:signal transduction histidine kinase/HAMP domain-containing protein